MKQFNLAIFVVLSAKRREEEIKNVYKYLDNTKVLCKSREIAITTREQNVEKGKERENKIVGTFELGF